MPVVIPTSPSSPKIEALLTETLRSLGRAPLEGNGVVERVADGSFVIRPIGVGSSSNIATIADAGGNGSSYIRTDSAYTLQNVGTAQQIFSNPANGRLTLETGTYLFEALISLSGMSATSGNALFSILGAGGASIGSVLYMSSGVDSAAGSAGAGGFSGNISSSSPASAVPAGTATGLQLACRGTFEITVAGTIVPSLTLVTAVGTAVVAVGSYFKCDRIGSTTAVSVGLWD